MHNLLKNLAGAAGGDVANILENIIEIKADKACQRSGASYAENIDVLCADYGVHHTVELIHGGILKGAADFFNVHVEDLGQHVGAVHAVAGYFNALNGGQLVANHFLQSVLKLRVAVVAEFGSEAYNCGFGNADNFAKARCGHKGSLVVMLQNEVADSLLSL